MTVTSASPVRRDGRDESRRARTFRPEVQGLRALAVLMVVCYHVWLGRVSGGVDVFLMLSAFLLTGSFIRKLDRGRPLALGGYWVHLFKRLLPAAVTVIVLVMLATVLVLPRSAWSGVVEQSWASLSYVQNWLLASQAVDYYAAHDTASPLQHFWSLSIQGQVFILWPLLFLAGRALTAPIARRVRWVNHRTVMFGIFSLVFVASLLFSVVETATNQAFAYFDTRARLFEFAFGSLLALTIDRLVLPRRLRVLLGWAGVVAMLACGFVLTVDRAFPGVVALWPVLAAAAIVVAGRTGSPLGADRLLSCRPLVRLGDISYALYLVHWPALIVLTLVTGRTHPGPVTGALLVVGSAGLAWLITRYVERPIRTNAGLEAHRLRAAAVIVVCVALVATPLTLWQQRLDADRAAAAAAVGDGAHPGALVLADPTRSTPTGVEPVPAVSAIREEFAGLPHGCTEDLVDAALLATCSQLAEADADATASRTLYVVGDSHAEQWLPPVRAVAERNGWNVVSVLLGGCALAVTTGADACAEHNRRVLDTLTAVKPDAVVVVSTAASAEQAQDTVRPGFEDAVAALTDDGIEVVGLRDNPRFARDLTACAQKQGADDPDCNPARSTALTDTNPADAIADRIPAFHSLDLTDLICGPITCAPVQGNVRVFIDDNHVTATYAATMTEPFAQRLFAATRWAGA
ncbi:acyltransferase [Tersicoccus solisilvae]|uniref:Acyltransferase n=1 Tax=Tersicoccus solisilvae TaxID=1882339 RepID=A0ABQ1NXX7_9MICC|nr:acyltransferase family protein [Tersicoccus solisilvae]GGC85623.1 acyltransferase [Tersicoccus solisilvae]